MKPFLHFLAALLLASLQPVLLRHLGGGIVSLALPLPCVVHLGLRAGVVEGALGSAAVGFVLDLMAGGPKGLLTFLAVLVFLVSRLVGASLEIRNRFGFAALSGVMTFLFGFGAWLLTRYVSEPVAAPGGRLLLRVLIEAILTGVAAPAVGFVLQRIDRLVEREEPGLLR